MVVGDTMVVDDTTVRSFVGKLSPVEPKYDQYIFYLVWHLSKRKVSKIPLQCRIVQAFVIFALKWGK